MYSYLYADLMLTCTFRSDCTVARRVLQNRALQASCRIQLSFFVRPMNAGGMTHKHPLSVYYVPKAFAWSVVVLIKKSRPAETWQERDNTTLVIKL
jgi:hypothetical protein